MWEFAFLMKSPIPPLGCCSRDADEADSESRFEGQGSRTVVPHSLHITVVWEDCKMRKKDARASPQTN